MTKNCRKFLLIGLLFAGTNAFAMDVKGVPLYVQGQLGWSYANATALSGFGTPKMMEWNAGVNVNYKINDMFMAGVSSDFNLARQYNDVSSTLANFRGWRWNYVSPTFGLTMYNVTALADFEFLGPYKFSNTTTSGDSVSYKGVLGGRLRASYPVWNQVSAGMQFEYLTFGTQNYASTGDTVLASRVKFWQLGLTASYAL